MSCPPCEPAPVPAGSQPANSSPASSPQRRQMGFFSVIAMVVGLQLGSGTFLLPSQLAPFGIYGLLSWFVTGAGALALCGLFAWLVARMPHISGGPHAYVQNFFGARWGFHAFWLYWLVSCISSVPLLLLAANSFADIWFISADKTYHMLFMAALCASVIGLNARGTKWSGMGEIVLSTLKTIPVLLVPLLTIPFWKNPEICYTPCIPAWKALGAASMLGFWGFIGLEGATAVAGCVHNPARTLPKALIAGTTLVLVLYMLNTLGLMAVVPNAVLRTSHNPYGDALAKIFTSVPASVIHTGLSALMFVMCAGTLNSWILATGNMLYSAGNDGWAPLRMARLNRWASPVPALTASCGVLMAVYTMNLWAGESFAQRLGTIIVLSNGGFVVLYALVLTGIWYQWIKRRLSVPMAMRCGLVVASLFCAGFMVHAWWEVMCALSFFFVCEGVWRWQRLFQHASR